MSAAPITLNPVFPLWLVITLFLVACAAVLIQYRMNRDKLGTRRAALLSSLRFAALALLVALALNPTLMMRKEQRISPTVAVIVDSSQSMGQSAPGTKISPLGEAKDLLTKGFSPLLSSLRKKYALSLYGLSDTLTPLGTNDLDLLRAGGKKGNIRAALKTLSGRSSIALLLSNGNLEGTEDQLPPLPTIAVPLGDPAQYRDILIKEIKAPPLAFRGREIVIDVQVVNHGYKGLLLPVMLKDSGKELASVRIPLRSNEGVTTASLTFTPGEAGQRNLSLTIPRQQGEYLALNNQVNFTLNVVRDKTRILMVSGTPSMNYRILRGALKGDPSLDLLSFVVLRTPSDILNVSPNEQSLIPFPAETLFTKELKTFDLLLFDNFDYSVYLRPPYLESIKKFVKDGGAFALIGGANVFNEGANSASPLGELLPFRFMEKEFYRRDAPAGVRLTPAGLKHPLMKISGDSGDSEAERRRFWRDMAPLEGINVTDAKKSATVLLESAAGIAWPILTVSEFGKGRVLALTTDYSWKWYMTEVAAGKGNRHYLLFVHRMIRWLTKDPSLDPLQIILPETAPSTGQEAGVRIQLAGDDPYRKSPGAVSFSVFDPDGARIGTKFKTSPRGGENYLSFTPEKAGIYRIKAETPFTHQEASLVVAGPFDRLDAAPDHGRLSRIAAATGGRYLPPGNNNGNDILKAIEDYAKKTEKQLVAERDVPLWATPVLMVVILALLSLEWYFRRRWGLT